MERAIHRFFAFFVYFVVASRLPLPRWSSLYSFCNPV